MYVRNEPIFHIQSSGVKLIYNILHNIEKTMKTVSSIPVLRYLNLCTLIMLQRTVAHIGLLSIDMRERGERERERRGGREREKAMKTIYKGRELT